MANKKIDQNFDKMMREYVCKNQRRSICLSLRDGEAVLCGEENSVDLALENLESMTVGELIEAMKVMDTIEDPITFKTSKQENEISFPPFAVKFKGRLWTAQKARGALIKILNLLGFGKGGLKSFKVATDEPEGWPDEYSFELFKHPSYVNMKACNDIIESLMRYHGVDAHLHPHITEEPPTPQKRKRKGRKAEETVEDDPNDNSVVENLDEDASEEVSPPEKRRKEKGEYEKMRYRNVAERRALEKSLGIIPHSQEEC